MNILKQIDKKLIVGMDWKQSCIDLAFYNDDNEIVTIKETGRLFDIISKYSPKFSYFIFESSSESFNLPEKNRIFSTFSDRIKVINSRNTSHYRERFGYSEKTDAIDAKTILRIVLETDVHIADPVYYDPNNEYYKEVSILMRKIVKYRSQNYTPVTEEDKVDLDLPLNILESLRSKESFFLEYPELLEYPIEKKKRGNGYKKWSISEGFVLSVILVALNSKSRRDFDRKMGYNGNGYPSIMRSNFYFWRTRILVGQKLEVRKISDLDIHNVDGPRKEIMTKLRKACRALRIYVNEYQKDNLGHSVIHRDVGPLTTQIDSSI